MIINVPVAHFDEYKWPLPYESHIFKNMVFVVGCGRSDLSTAVNLLCSLKPTYHLYTPVLLKTVLPNADNEKINYYRHVILSSLLYDYLVPIARGMYITDNPVHRTFSDMYWATCPEERLRRRELSMQSTSGLMKLLEENPIIGADMCEGIMWRNVWEKLFPECSFINIVRNGHEIVTARVNSGWDRSTSLTIPIGPIVDWMKTSPHDQTVFMPWFIDEEVAINSWHEWNPQTRAAHLWRIQAERSDMFETITYEEMISKPEGVVENLCYRFKSLQQTKTSNIVAERVKSGNWWVFEYAHKNPVDIHTIAQPEQDLFMQTMEKFGYSLIS